MNEEELSVGETIVLLSLYAAERIDFQGGSLRPSQVNKVCGPWYSATREEIDDLQDQIINDDDACRKFLLPLTVK